MQKQVVLLDLSLETSNTQKNANQTFACVAAFQDSQKKLAPQKNAYSDVLDQIKKDESYNADVKTARFLRYQSSTPLSNVVLVGLGQPSALTLELARQSGGTVYQKLVAEGVKSISVEADSFSSVKGLKNGAGILGAFLEGMVLKAYSFDKYKTSSKKTENLKVSLSSKNKSSKSKLTQLIKDLQDMGEAIGVTRNWSNEPSNMGTPEYFAKEAAALAKAYGLKCKILTEADAKKEKMGLFLGVGAGSTRDGYIVVLEYTPKAKKCKTVALVGKGITFDSGGISIKPSLRMEEMKHDMTGAATLMGATLLAAKRKVKNKVVTILGFTENMPDGSAIQPGNILTARSGKTVEVINTDAEGRLILGDLLDYAHEYKPDVILDAATLTGACGIALGKQCCAILGNDEALISQLRKLGDYHGERAWQLPLFDEYFEDMKSEHADIRNSVNDSLGGTIRGAIFLKQFIKNNTSWAHFDIAYTGSDLGHLPYYPRKGATGAHVRTIAQFTNEY